MQVTIYVNNSNPNKFLEVHSSKCYHNALRQYMEWKDVNVRNYTGDQKLHRWRKRNLLALLRDYTEVSSTVICR